MNTVRLARRRAAFTLVEMMVASVIVFVLAALLLPLASQTPKKSSQIGCANNLKQIGLGFKIFAVQHGNRFPWETNQQARIETFFMQSAGKPANPRILVCPSDVQRTPASLVSNHVFVAGNHLSYFVNAGSNVRGINNFMLGDRNISVSGVVTSSAALAWGGPGARMHGDAGNAAMTDGSVHPLSARRLRNQVDALLKHGGRINIRLPE